MERLLAAVLVLGIAVFELIHAVFDGMIFSSQAEFIGLVISMSATMEPESLRAVHSPTAANLFYGAIWLAHALSGLVALAGAWLLLTAGGGGEARSRRAYTVAVTGVGIGAILYLVGFHTVSDGWFKLWQAPTPPNYLADATRYFLTYMVVIIYLMQARRPVDL